jgi:hypothetical protein
MPLNAVLAVARSQAAQAEQRIVELSITVQKLKLEGKHNEVPAVLIEIAKLEQRLEQITAHIRAITLRMSSDDTLKMSSDGGSAA